MTAPLAEVVRSGFVESVHRGSVVVLDASGTVVAAAGTPDAPVFPRSANKPLQAAAMLRAGAVLAPPELALAAGSHSGEPFHVAVVRAMLAADGLGEDALGCPPALPLDPAPAQAVLAAGGGPARVLMNCSGKHAAMLRTCLAGGWPTAGYLDPGHPLQKHLRATLEELAGEPVAAVGMDGCGAPVFALSLTGVARAFTVLVAATPGSAERRVADAMRQHPELAGGTGRDVTALMAGVPGLVAKDGAEGVYAAALPGVGAVALKIEDGAGRGRVPVLVAALRLLGVDAPVLDELARPPLRSGDQPVGEVRAVWPSPAR